ncbi:TIGR03854 family LLM class F420-dependent oxidoreductase [Dactylosporangium sp. CA-092794]|uniref:TIGR03854 family LLM class F420-dependent oxidoreductase n=1 Tax=Dactylosporangium sp. CA-092794 TaxID=3239929 RepID=UPI003D89FCBC
MLKIRFGVGLGADTAPAELAEIVEHLEASGVDSLWLSEQVYSSAVEPVVGLAYALARTRRLKVGTSVAVLPGRHPALVAKQLASLAALAPRRVLPVFGLRPARSGEVALFAVPEGRRAAVFDESLVLLRRLLTEDEVSFSGEFFTVQGARIGPRPARPLDIWLGGSAPAGLRRIGRLGDGWLGSFVTPAEARAAVDTIRAAAADAGREIEPDHYGISLVVAGGDLPDALAATLRQRRPDLDPAELVARDWPHLHRLLDEYIAAGLSKFVIRTVAGPAPIEFIDRFVTELLPRQN